MKREICDHDCFHCTLPDCIIETVSQIERQMQDYRDACIIVQGKIAKAHKSGSRNRGRKGGRYTTGVPYKTV